MILRDFEVHPAKCPSCGTNLTHAAALGATERPKAGDLTVCAYCATPLEWTPDLELRALAPSELVQLRLFEPEAAALVDRAVRAIRELRS